MNHVVKAKMLRESDEPIHYNCAQSLFVAFSDVLGVSDERAFAIGTDDKEHKTFKDKGRGGGTEGEESQDLKGKKENVCYRAAQPVRMVDQGCVRRRS